MNDMSNNDMNEIKELRLLLGITQPELAAYLDITLSSLSMAECDLRFLSPAPSLKFRKIQQALAQAPVAPQQFITTYNRQTALQQLTRYLLKSRQELAGLQQKLNKMQQQLVQAQNMLQVIAILRPMVPAGSKGGDDRRWLQMHEAEAKGVLNTNGPGLQAVLQVRIDILIQALEKTEAAISTLKEG